MTFNSFLINNKRILDLISLPILSLFPSFLMLLLPHLLFLGYNHVFTIFYLLFSSIKAIYKLFIIYLFILIPGFKNASKVSFFFKKVSPSSWNFGPIQPNEFIRFHSEWLYKYLNTKKGFSNVRLSDLTSWITIFQTLLEIKSFGMLTLPVQISCFGDLYSKM